MKSLIFEEGRGTIAAMYAARLRESLPRVRERVAAALDRSGRSDEVGIVAITKGHPADAVRAAVQAGLQVCGENRVAELARKWAEMGNLAKQTYDQHLQYGRWCPFVLEELRCLG